MILIIMSFFTHNQNFLLAFTGLTILSIFYKILFKMQNFLAKYLLNGKNLTKSEYLISNILSCVLTVYNVSTNYDFLL